jgi:hypothetical protein
MFIGGLFGLLRVSGIPDMVVFLIFQESIGPIYLSPPSICLTQSLIKNEFQNFPQLNKLNHFNIYIAMY